MVETHLRFKQISASARGYVDNLYGLDHEGLVWEFRAELNGWVLLNDMVYSPKEKQ